MAATVSQTVSFQIFSILLLVVMLSARGTAAPAFGNTEKAMMYLARFGYLSPSVRNPSFSHIIDEGSWKQAIAEFQSFIGLNTTGELDTDTVEAMSLPRCGVRDKVGFGETRAKRFLMIGSWPGKNLTYKISKYSSKLNRQEVDAELAKAFSLWSRYTDLTFEQKKSGQVHIEIRFEKGEHGDGEPFDGPEHILGHAFLPAFGGDVHFNDDKQWSVNSFSGTNLFQIAAHEIGHALGLPHSDVESALMSPKYRGYDPAFNLDEDDILGIQALYGNRTGNNVVTTPQPTVEDPALCADPKIDTIFISADGGTFIFKGENYWRLTERGLAAGYPRLISSSWPGLPGNIDAAFTYTNGKTYFFKGSKYWRYKGQKMDMDYPKEISEGFTGIPDNLDAALVWSGNGKIYFYKGSKFWKFDPAQQPPVKSAYPKPLSNWKGIPDNIDAAFQYTNGYTYFLKQGQYWRFSDITFSVDTNNPAYPRSTAYWMMGCSKVPKGTVASQTK